MSSQGTRLAVSTSWWIQSETAEISTSRPSLRNAVEWGQKSNVTDFEKVMYRVGVL